MNNEEEPIIVLRHCVFIILYIEFGIWFFVFRKEFRTVYGNLDLLSNVFPNVPIVAMTATAIENMQLKIVENLLIDCP